MAERRGLRGASIKEERVSLWSLSQWGRLCQGIAKGRKMDCVQTEEQFQSWAVESHDIFKISHLMDKDVLSETPLSSVS